MSAGWVGDHQIPVVPQQHASGVVHYVNQLTRPSVPTLSGTIVYHAVITGAPSIAGAGQIGSIGGHTGPGLQHGFKVPGTGSGDIVPAMLEPGELVVPKGMVAAGAVDHLRGTIPGFAAGGLAGVDVPFVTGVGTAFRIAMQETVNDLLTALGGVLGQAASGIRFVCGRRGGLPHRSAAGAPCPGRGL